MLLQGRISSAGSQMIPKIKKKSSDPHSASTHRVQVSIPLYTDFKCIFCHYSSHIIQNFFLSSYHIFCQGCHFPLYLFYICEPCVYRQCPQGYRYRISQLNFFHQLGSYCRYLDKFQIEKNIFTLFSIKFLTNVTESSTVTILFLSKFQ